MWRLLVAHAALAADTSYIRWVAPLEGEVPSESHLHCEVMAWLDDHLREQLDVSICIQVDSQAPSSSFCEPFRKPGIVSFELPIELVDGQLTLTATLGTVSGSTIAALGSDQVRVQKWLQLARPRPGWAEVFNPLVEWWDAHREGLQTTKLAHYFDVYHRHLSHFRGRKAHLLEIGVASGGSLQMWKAYFGPRLRVTGVDCCPYSGMRGELEDHRTSIWIGDQEDPQFWEELVQSVPPIDIIIDDGSHVGRMQLAAFRSLWPRLNPGGVYLVEDLMFAYLEPHSQDAHFFRGHTLWMERLKLLMDEMQTGLAGDELKGSVGTIRSINVYRHICVVEKYDQGQGDAGFVQDWEELQVGAGVQAPALADRQVQVPMMSHPA
ncbi:unnamed protein product [Effrenium voratum]|nr:unnamed protein product [Effrenium voratum]CAJ1431836.1 unnamed protein product [Effrenium voratum]